ncbi:MAG: polysaccharide deacetylase family protein [Chitinophagales bacterium]
MIKRITNKVRSLAIDASYQLNLLPHLIGKKSNHIILMYHGVLPGNAKQFNTRHQFLKDFVNQIKYFKTHCHIISVKDFCEGKFVPGKQNIALTFDDGYLNNYKYAFPVLEEYKAPATFYITGLNNTNCNILWPDFLEIATQLTSQPISIQNQLYIKQNNIYIEEKTKEPLYAIIRKKDFQFKNDMIEAFDKHIVDFRNIGDFDGYWKLMSDDQIKEVGHSKYIKIGSHGYYHNNLGEIKIEDAIEEMQLSKNYLEKLVPYKIDEIAYPDGSYSKEVALEALKLGLKYQLLISYKSDDDKNIKSLYERFGIYPCESNANQILAALKN